MRGAMSTALRDRWVCNSGDRCWARSRLRERARNGHSGEAGDALVYHVRARRSLVPESVSRLYGERDRNPPERKPAERRDRKSLHDALERQPTLRRACADRVPPGMCSRGGRHSQANGRRDMSATWAGLILVTFPVVAAQAWTAQNDLVVAAFLGTAAYFLLATPARLCTSRSCPRLGYRNEVHGCSFDSRPPARAGRRTRRQAACKSRMDARTRLRRWRYLVRRNLVETGRLDGGLARSAEQTPGSVGEMLATLQRFLFDAFNLSASPRPIGAGIAHSDSVRCCTASSGSHCCS